MQMPMDRSNPLRFLYCASHFFLSRTTIGMQAGMKQTGKGWNANGVAKLLSSLKNNDTDSKNEVKKSESSTLI